MDVGCVLGYEVASGVRWSDRAANEIHSQSGASTGMCEERRGESWFDVDAGDCDLSKLIGRCLLRSGPGFVAL